MCIALYSPPLDSIGNSVRGQQFCKVVFILILIILLWSSCSSSYSSVFINSSRTVVQGCLHPHPHPIFTLVPMIIIVLVFILMLILVHQSIKSIFARLSSSASSWRPWSSSSSLLINWSRASSLHSPFPWSSQSSWWSVFTILMISVHNLAPHADQCSQSWWSAFTILILMLISILMIRNWWTFSTSTASTIWGTATRRS